MIENLADKRSILKRLSTFMPGSRVDVKVFSSFKNIGAREVVVGRMKSHRRLSLSLENPLGKARENGLLFIFRLRLKRGQGTLVMGRHQKNMVKMYRKPTTELHDHDPLTIQYLRSNRNPIYKHDSSTPSQIT